MWLARIVNWLVVSVMCAELQHVELSERVDVWYEPDINGWQGRSSVEGRLLHLVANH